MPLHTSEVIGPGPRPKQGKPRSQERCVKVSTLNRGEHGYTSSCRTRQPRRAHYERCPELSRRASGIYTVVAFKGMPTHLWWGGLKDDPSLVHGLTHTDRFIIFGGGIPLRVKQKLVGAVGVSGGSAEQDQAIAEAGAKAL